MGLMDKVKAQATQVAQKAQEGVKAGQAKLEQSQSGKRSNALLRDLGAAVYAEKTGKGTPETAAEIERIVAELRSHEEEHGAIDTSATADTEAPSGETPSGDFKLDDM